MIQLDQETATMLRDAVGKHVERFADGKAVRRARKTLPGPQGASLEVLAEQGWLALALPEAAGGMELGLSAAGIVTEGLAKAYTSDPFLGLFIAARAYVLAGGGGEVFDGLGDGSAKLALAWQESASQWGDLSAKAVLKDGLLSGQKAWIVGAELADHYLVSATEGDDLVLALVARTAAGLSLTTEFRPDGAPIAGLTLIQTPAMVIARGSEAKAALRRALDEGSALIAAELMGHIDQMMALTLEHLKTRHQFGRAIGSYQALQHRAADMFVRQRLARAVLETGLARLDATADAVAYGQQAARLRARLNDTAQWVMRESIQLFGAMGITDENDLSLHLKRCMSLIGLLGNSTAQRRYYMDLADAEGQAA